MNLNCKSPQKESPGPVWSVTAFCLAVVLVAWIVAAVRPYAPW